MQIREINIQRDVLSPILLLSAKEEPLDYLVVDYS